MSSEQRWRQLVPSWCHSGISGSNSNGDSPWLFISALEGCLTFLSTVLHLLVFTDLSRFLLYHCVIGSVDWSDIAELVVSVITIMSIGAQHGM